MLPEQRAKYLERLKRTSNANNQSLNDDILTEYSEEDAQKDITFLKSLEIIDGNMHIFQKKLAQTIKERMKLVKMDGISLLETFPYFYIQPKLVSF